MKYILFLYIFFAAMSCKKDMYSEISFHVPEFKDSVLVKADVLNDTLYTRGIWVMAPYKDYIIAKGIIDDHMFHFFSKKDGKKVKSFGEFGRGPNQLINVQGVSVDAKQGSLTTFSGGGHEIFTFHLDSILEGKENILTKLPLERIKGFFNSAYKCGNHFLLSSLKSEVYPQNTRFKLASAEGKMISSYDQYSINSNSDSLKRAWDWITLYPTSTLSPDGSKYAEATRIGGIMEILHIKDRITFKTVKFFYKPHFHWVNDNPKYTAETQFGFYHLNSSDRYIYALSFNGSNQDDPPTTEVQVFDREANPVKKYKTNYSLINICPDEEAEKIYAIGINPMREFTHISFDMKKK